MSRFARYHLPTLLWALAMITATSIPSLPTPSLPLIPAQDKVFHFAEYLVLGFLSLRSAQGMGKPLSVPTLMQVAGAGLLFGLLDELHQIPLPGRDASPYDFLADAVGVVLGVALYWAVRRWHNRQVTLQQKER